jgi:ubiquinol-cytochrome c reductase iron-sulfur subunit
LETMANHTSAPEALHPTGTTEPKEATRRDFMVLAAAALGGVGAVATAIPFVSSMNPSADVLALSSAEVDLTPIQPGQSIKVKWRGKPVFVRRRTPKEIAEAKDAPMNELPDPEADSARVKAGHDEWLVVIGVCTHLGCIPLVNEGLYGGWFCPCHGSQYDTSGRIRRGPAPKNLVVPEYSFLTPTRIRIG